MGVARMHAVRTLIVAGLLVPWAMGQTSGAATDTAGGTCVSCHGSLGGEFAAPVEVEQTSVHHQHGISCADCHGGNPAQADPDQAMSPAAGFVGRPKRHDIPRFCGKCHSDAVYMKRFDPSLRVDQETEYRTSVHGTLLRQGDQKVANCISCHGHHGILPVASPKAPVYPTNVARTCGACHADAAYMQPYAIPTNQVEEYKKSVHANALMNKQDLSAPTCNDCHGNHGATPPGVDSVANVCGTCHVRQSEMFQDSPHRPAFAAMQLPGCVACHGNHQVEPTTDEMLGVGDGAFCVRCHVADDPGFQAARQMRASVDELAGHISSAEQVLQQAQNAGMEVSRPLFDLQEAGSALVQARVSVHSFSPAQLESVVKPGLDVASKAHQAGEDALHELNVRRLGLAASLVVILLAVVAIYFKVRQMDSGA